ncbi:hypothetical protein [Halorussus salinus]|uniref:hypothetical protein n=1 Tax=Halorussus salinus TaxID=1364935 RepID=UPI0010926D44|nr:hypothetical protein [Halorussus salinus]
MSERGRLRGVYNIVVAGEYETVEYQIPVEEFRDRLESDDVPDEVTVVGLEDAYDDEFIADLSRVMDRRADDLENADPTPMIQFEIDADIHRGDVAFDIFTDDAIYPLHELFGRQMQCRNSEKTWFTVPF